jgi:S-adenosylmethionine hydrolase
VTLRPLDRLGAQGGLPVVTLLTDFGAGSGYPAQVKGVLLRLVPEVRLVDVSHDVPAYDVLAGALLLEACVRWFPTGAVHFAVVDPGVGTARRALAVVDPEGRRFVGPDNGLLTPFLGPGARVHQIAPGEAVPVPASATFHGRDLFAPAAALLASGTDPSALGPAVLDPVRLDWPAARRRGRELAGTTLAADSFGNLLTSVTEADLGGAPVARAAVEGRPVRWVHTFGEAEPGELVAYLGSGGRVEVAAREGSAALALGGARGHEVRIVLAR